MAKFRFPDRSSATSSGSTRDENQPRIAAMILPFRLPRWIDWMLGRSPGECRKGQHAPTWRKAADDQLAA